MTAPDVRRRGALAALRSGRVSILDCRQIAPGRADSTPDMVSAAVRSSRPGGPVYAVDFFAEASDGIRWSCTCRATPDCAHILAVQLVTTGPQDSAGAGSGQGPVPADQCSATNPTGQRCALPAGHDEQHRLDRVQVAS